MGPDPLEHEPRREQPQLPGLVQVNVDRHVMALLDVEHDVEVLHRILIKAARVNAAHHIGALAQRGLHQGRNARLEEKTGLREGDDLDRGTLRVGFAGSLDSG